MREVEKVRPSDLDPLTHTDQDTLTLLTRQGYDPEDETYACRYTVRAVLVEVATE